MFNGRKTRGHERLPYDEVIAHAARWNIPLEAWQLTGRSLLNRDYAGNFKFAHRTIMEYFAVQRALIDWAPLATEWTDQMEVFFREALNGTSAMHAQRLLPTLFRRKFHRLSETVGAAEAYAQSVAALIGTLHSGPASQLVQCRVLRHGNSVVSCISDGLTGTAYVLISPSTAKDLRLTGYSFKATATPDETFEFVHVVWMLANVQSLGARASESEEPHIFVGATDDLSKWIEEKFERRAR